jgi:hypothetical protein
MTFTDESLAWQTTGLEDLWVLDKLLLSRHLGYACGPVGVDVPRPGHYIVRPCVNALGMGLETSKVFIKLNTDHLPVGNFWCELFEGRHLSVDFNYGKQVLCVEGFRDSTEPYWRWAKWGRTDDIIQLPEFIQTIANKYEWFNTELISDHVIEVHFRANPDFWIPGFENIQEVIPIWHDEPLGRKEGYQLISDPDFNTVPIRKALLVKAG